MSDKFIRHFLKNKEVKNFLNNISNIYKIDSKQLFKKNVKIELVKTELADIYLADGKPILFKRTDLFIPTLVFHNFFELAPKIVVDMGAVPHLCNGANVMAPGIVRFEGAFNKGDFVFIIDETYGKPLAVGKVTYSIEEVKKIKRGIIVKNIHFVGDKIWEIIKKMNQTELRDENK